MSKPKIYLGTVALEMNRWSSRIPTFLVSQWIPKIQAAGFEGLELWENHVLLNPGEAQKIKATGFPVAIYNHYSKFSSSLEDIEKREAAVKMICYLGAGAVKYNIGNDQTLLPQYRENVLRFADTLPEDCMLLCECHDGTLLETNDAIEAFFEGLCPKKFGLMVHPFGCPDILREKFARFGPRIAHMHSQLAKEDNMRMCLEAWPERVQACFGVMKEYSFAGNFTVEFTGLTAAPGENIERLFANTVKDMEYIRKSLS